MAASKVVTLSGNIFASAMVKIKYCICHGKNKYAL